jgi:hypothetical protein
MLKKLHNDAMAIYHQCNNTRSNALANHSIALKINKCCMDMFITQIDDTAIGLVNVSLS